MMRHVRAVILSGYIEVARFVGLDGQRMLREAGIPIEALANPDNRLPAAAVAQLFESSAEQSGCESFGLLMVESRSFASLGPLSLLLEHLPNPRAVVRASIEFQRHLNDVISISLEEDGDPCLIRLDLEPGFWGVQLFDHVVAMAYRVLTHASGNRWQPDCVHLMRAAPRDMGAWRRFFPVPIEFAASCNGHSASHSSMLMPNPLADEAMAHHARRLLQLLPLESEPPPASERVGRVITLLLPSGRATLNQTAAQLGVSPRSLQRQLADEGHQFAELLDSVRHELAAAYLGGSSHSITTVSGLLGYASPSSSTRWFAGEFGESPQAWRAHRVARDAPGPPPTWR